MCADGRVGAQSLGVRNHVGESALVPLLAAVLVSFMVAVATPVEIATVACGADLAGESGRAGAGAGTRVGVCLGSVGERGERGSAGAYLPFLAYLEWKVVVVVVVVVKSRGEVAWRRWMTNPVQSMS